MYTFFVISKNLYHRPPLFIPFSKNMSILIILPNISESLILKFLLRSQLLNLEKKILLVQKGQLFNFE